MIDYEAAAKAINDDGWTCDMHEPNDWCSTCKTLHAKTAKKVVAAALGDKVLYEPGIFIPGIGAPELAELVERGVLVQVYPEVDDD